MGKRLGAAALALALLAAGCAASPERAVLATVYPLYVALDNVAGDAGLSRGVLSAGIGGVLSDGDRAALSGYTAVLFASGSEKYLDEVRSGCPELSVVTVDDGLAEEASCPWTSVRAHMEEVERIAGALSAWDPGNGDAYRANADAYLASLAELDALYGRMLSNVAGQRVVLFRDTFKPLFTAYGLEVADIVSPEEEAGPAAWRLAGIVKTCKDRQVRLLVVDAGADPAAAEAVSAQTGVPVVELDPMTGFGAGGDVDDGGEYIRIMEENLYKVAQALIWNGQ